MVGYADDDDVPGGGYFIVRNSWVRISGGREGKSPPAIAACLRLYPAIRWEAYTVQRAILRSYVVAFSPPGWDDMSFPVRGLPFSPSP